VSLGPGLPVVSVIVLADNHADTVLRAVTSVVDQDLEELFEVIVVVSGSSPTAARVRQRFPSILMVESPVPLTQGGARNRGTSHAKGQVIAFLEGDGVARQGWLRNLLGSHQAGHHVVAGAVAVTKPSHAAARASLVLRFHGRSENGPAGPAGLARSFGLSFTREVLRRVGPFDEAWRTQTEYFMAKRLDYLGIIVWFEPSVCIEHVGPSRLDGLFEEQSSLGRRQARSDLLTVAPGSVRTALESRAAALALALRAARRLLGQARPLAGNLSRCAPARRDALMTAPCVVLGLLANASGWLREQHAYEKTGAFTESDGAGPTPGSLRRRTTTTGEKTLVLTFDDGPSEYTPDVLRALSRYGVPATFFVLGEQAATMPDVISAISDSGCSLAVHGWSHTPFTELDAQQLARDLGRTRELLRRITGSDCHDIRPPMGFYDGDVISRLAELDLVTWLWTAEARDWAPEVSADQIAERILLSLTPGGVILLHDGGGDRSRTVRALPRIIEGAFERGYRFVALDDVRGTPGPVLS
jgi:peptidoglycan/xylan/chitin deacetylase (PgdA/CDA1 family)/GT2 family glycosyltransferase